MTTRRRVIVIGAPGQLGAEVVSAFEHAGDRVVGLGHDALDITDRAAVESILAAERPTLVVNSAAFHNVDKCELDPTRAFAVNAIGAWHVAQAADRCGAGLIHISTDYVFDGLKGSPYTEDDLPQPLNVYGASKLAGEHLVLAANGRSFVVRVSGLYGPHPCRAKGGLNFPQLMLRLAREKGELTVVSDEFVAPTYTRDLALQLVTLAGTDAYGVVHASGAGQTSWHGLAVETLRLASLDHVPVREASASTMPRPVRRPTYSVLAHSRLQALGVDQMPDWHDSLRTYMLRPGSTPQP